VQGQALPGPSVRRSHPAHETDVRSGCRADGGARSRIGANAAIFSVCQAILFKPLPYPEPDRVVMVWERMKPTRGRGASSNANEDRPSVEDPRKIQE
jgi:hypothetical protein